MKYLSKVVWSEGMHLAPHHFQAQARFFEDVTHFALSHIFFACYGLAGYELDAEALRNGTLSIIHARGIFSDGLAFHMPQCDPLPEPRSIANLFSPTRENHMVVLAVDPYRQNRANCNLPDEPSKNGVRFSAETQTVTDETTGRDEKPVIVARKNIQLLLDIEVKEGMLGMPIARIRRDATGHFIFDPNFIPPVLQIAASTRILYLLKRLIELKVAGQEVVQAPDHEEPKILNLMDALKKSVVQAQAKLAGGTADAESKPASAPADAGAEADKKLAPSAGRKKGPRKVEGG